MLAAVAFAISSANPEPQDIIDFGAEDKEKEERFQSVIEGLCENRPPNEYFRLSTESNCRDAVRCVQNDFRGGHSLAAVRCPNGLVFDLDGQTCDWASKVSVQRRKPITYNYIGGRFVRRGLFILRAVIMRFSLKADI